MKYVDLIIQFLSGELSEGESEAFEKELEKNNVLRDEYEQVSAAYRLIRDQLGKEDMAHFRARLREVMERPLEDHGGDRSRRGRWWLLLLPLAASLAVLIMLYANKRDGPGIFSRFYRPDKDPVVLAFNQDQRGEMEVGIAMYQGGHYEISMQIMDSLLEENPGNQMVLLYYLLSSIELDRVEEAIPAVMAADVSTDHTLGQAVAWYSGLAFIKTGHYDEAITDLAPLEQHPGPYRKRSRRLIKLLQRGFSSP
jgi:tetratricopeptide (TPR) repeat protein